MAGSSSIEQLWPGLAGDMGKSGGNVGSGTVGMEIRNTRLESETQIRSNSELTQLRPTRTTNRVYFWRKRRGFWCYKRRREIFGSAHYSGRGLSSECGHSRMREIGSDENRTRECGTNEKKFIGKKSQTGRFKNLKPVQISLPPKLTSFGRMAQTRSAEGLDAGESCASMREIADSSEMCTGAGRRQ